MMKAGEYYIGDLCYVMSDEEWGEICSLIETGNYGEFILDNGKNIAIYSTYIGDGVYQDEIGNDYSVDSGTIGCVLVSDIDVKIDDEMVVKTFSYDFDTYETSGIITIGETSINTVPADYDNDILDWNDSDYDDDDTWDRDELKDDAYDAGVDSDWNDK